MKHLFLLTIISAFVLAGCKKDNIIDATTIRIERTEVSSGNNVFSRIFSYDPQGRLIRVSYKTNNNPEVTSGTITYSGNDVFIQPVLPNGWTHEIRYQLNSEKRPLYRLETGTRNFNSSPVVQHDYFKYESDYQYNTAGFLFKINKSSYDSTHHVQPTGTTIETVSTSTVTDFTITSNNLSKVREFSQAITELRISPGGNFAYTDTRIKVWDFGYNRKFPNKTDYLNNFLIIELSGFLVDWFPHNAGLDNAPDLITYNESFNGQNTSNQANEIEYTYNKYGFISSIKDKDDPTQPPVKIFYNK